jgi:hypothetical protein
MPTHSFPFIFDENFGIANDSIFTLIDEEAVFPLPPIGGFLLETDDTPLLLSDGSSFLSLA